MRKRTCGTIFVFIIIFVISACAPTAGEGSATLTLTRPGGNPPTPRSLSDTAAPTFTFPPIISLTPTLTLTPTDTQTPTLTPAPTETLPPSPTPTYAVLRGKAIPEKLSCRFGPGIVYLFKFSVFGNIEIIGRMERSSWILVQAIGGHNACWVNGDYVEVNGDIMSVEPVDPHIVLPWSYIYLTPLTGVSATRVGDTVTVFWNELVLNAGDSSEQVPYVVEAWVCVDGEIVFNPVGSYSWAAEVTDEQGCDEPSHGRVFAAEKHGYTQWIELQWPPHE